MNTKQTKQFIEQNGIVAVKADKSRAEKEVDDLLHKLGNQSGAIPFYAIFPAGRPNEPILLDGLLTQKRIIDALQQAGPSQVAADTAPRTAPVAAMREL